MSLELVNCGCGGNDISSNKKSGYIFKSVSYVSLVGSKAFCEQENL